MHRRVVLHMFFWVLIAGLTVSCGNFRKIEKSEDWRVKYEAALEYYENEDYFRSSTLFEQILPIVRGMPEGEKVQFYYAYSQYYQRLYDLAAHHFKVFYETYGRSEFAQEAAFMYAYSLYAASPSYNLDQSNSIQALMAMQQFINRYPTSEFVDEASEVIDEVQVRLEKKGYENAKQYYRMQKYNAAVVSFQSFSENFPDSEYNEELAYLKFMAQFKYADNSIPSKQLERYREANRYYEEFVDRYPESEYIRQAEKIYVDSLEKISEIAKN
ncbi:MAG: outer membrane protein assembly factor BamD [Cyclobacteriaceae bacterium]